MRRPLVIAHQGSSALRPPNTLVAFDLAVEMGADVIEIDVTYTADGAVVVSHDLTVDACTDGHGFIPEMTLAEVRSLDAGVRFGREFVGLRIPTLEETIAWARGKPVRLCIEVKGDELEHYLRAGEATVALLQRLDFLQPVTLTAFSPECIRAMRAREPRLAWGLDPDEHRQHSGWELCQQVLSCGATFLLHRHDTLKAEIVEEAHQHGFAVWTWTIDEPEAMRRACVLGADGIMSNRPDVLRVVVNERGQGW